MNERLRASSSAYEGQMFAQVCMYWKLDGISPCEPYSAFYGCAVFYPLNWFLSLFRGFYSNEIVSFLRLSFTLLNLFLVLKLISKSTC